VLTVYQFEFNFIFTVIDSKISFLIESLSILKLFNCLGTSNNTPPPLATRSVLNTLKLPLKSNKESG
jgi:hypothetical protein